jgi:putative CocE/NonD family hydrolase
MSQPPSKSKSDDKPVSSMSMLERAGTAPPPLPDRMPLPDHRCRVPMRDGVRLDTQVWLPGAPEAVPAILLRTPYKEQVMGWKRLGVLRYVQRGYAVVIQLIRGVGDSQGRFSFSAPEERTDGYDTVEWIAAQPWCDGKVGMDGSSYVGMTQLAAASAKPPHLRCIVPAVAGIDFFREVPYSGGIFSRQHTMNWTHLLQIESLAEQTMGFTGVLPVLSQPTALCRMTMRPLREAADGELTGDFLAHYQNVLEHSTMDAWWQERHLSSADFAAMDIPTLVVTGNFDLSIGSLALWRGLEANAGHAQNRHLLIGPWDHGQCYSGGGDRFGPYALGDDALVDLQGLRLEFFDRHLKGCGEGSVLENRVKVFITGLNSWRHFDCFPPREVRITPMYLASGGHANSARGDGRLQADVPTGDEPADAFVDDPNLPFVAGFTAASAPQFPQDMRERERHHETLVYDSGPLASPLTILGEPEVELFAAADAPDADLVVWLAEHRSDGLTLALGFGQLRLRYRGGFDAERLLTPGEPVQVRIPITYVGHQVPAGSRLRLLISGSQFPFTDPNPHTGEPIASATVMRSCVQTIFHDAHRPSCLMLPTLP